MTLSPLSPRVAIMVIALLAASLACSVDVSTPAQVTQPAPPTMPGSAPVSALGQRTKTTGCVANGSLPDAACTPGAIFPDATVDQICTTGYSSKVRNVPQDLKDQVYAEYGIASHEPGQYEVDHLVPLEVGGSNDIANLWPEAADPRPGFHEKDTLENYVHDQICSGKLPLRDAQAAIASNWLAVYQGMR